MERLTVIQCWLTVALIICSTVASGAQAVDRSSVYVGFTLALAGILVVASAVYEFHTKANKRK